MKLKDVLLITNNNKGTEYKYLSSMEDYMAILLRAFEGSETELAHAVQELCQTKENSQYAEVYLAANKTFHARFCSDEWELKDFLGGNHKMTEEEVSFDKDRCTKECLDVLTAYNMDHEGHPLIGNYNCLKEDVGTYGVLLEAMVVKLDEWMRKREGACADGRSYQGV